MKRFSKPAALLAAVAMALTACAQAQNAPSATPTAAPTAAPATAAPTVAPATTAPATQAPATAAPATQAPTQVAQPASATGDPNLNPPGTLPITKERTTLKVVYSHTQDLSKNYTAQAFSEAFGVDFEWVILPVDQYKEKLNLMLANGEYIDLIVSPNNAAAKFSKLEEFKYAQQGLLTPINDYIENSSKFIKELYAEYPQYYQATTTPDGNMYSFQSIPLPGSGAYHGTASYKMWLNNKWLENLGLAVPTTTDEFYEVLKAFKDEDANGNGDVNDEIPLSTCIAGANVQIDGFLMNSFIYNDPQPNRNGVRLRLDGNGKVMASYVTPEFREGLRYLNKLFVEGLLYPDSFTQDRATQTALNESTDSARIGALPAQHAGYLVASMAQSDRWMEYEALAPLKGPAGFQVTPTDALTGNSESNGLIPKTAKYPELAFRVIDNLYDTHWSYVSNWGEEGKTWRDATAGELGADGKPSIVTTMPLAETDPFYQNNTMTGWPVRPITHTGVTRPQDPKAPKGEGHEIVLYRATELYEPFKVEQKYILPSFYYLSEENEKISTYAATIDAYVTESIARFITDDLSLDDDWDAFLSELGQYGLQDYLSIIQAGYDRYLETAVN